MKTIIIRIITLVMLITTVGAQTPEALNTLWDDKNPVLVIGTQHNFVRETKLILETMPAWKARGMTRLAVEVPSYNQNIIDRFVAGKTSLEGFCKELWNQDYQRIPEGFQLLLQIMQWAKDNGVKIHAIDARKEMLYECASAQTVAARKGKVTFIDPNGARIVNTRGVMPRHEILDAQAANQLGVKLWIWGRTQEMAKNIEAIPLKDNERMLVICGAVHTGLEGWQSWMKFHGMDIADTPTEGIKDLLPAPLAAKTQTLLMLGGFSYQGDIRMLKPQMHAFEAHLVQKGFSGQLVVVKALKGMRGIDSVIFFPIKQVEAPLGSADLVLRSLENRG